MKGSLKCDMLGEDNAGAMVQSISRPLVWLMLLFENPDR
jgi:hypothetical protein